MRAVVIQKKAADGPLRRARHSEKKQRTATSEEAVTQSGPRLIASATMLFAVLRTPPLLLFAVLRSPLHRRTVRTYVCSLRTCAWWAAPPREDALIALGRRTRIAHRCSQLNDNARYAGYVVSVRTRCEGHAFENRCCRMNDIASQIQRKEERQELT